jgi:hypothetical protein
MGGAVSILPLQAPMCFSYYGPIRRAEASEALDAAITSHLHEIGAAPKIPIRKEDPDEIVVPVGLATPAFTAEGDSIVVHFAASSRGVVRFRTESSPEKVAEFREGHDQTFKFQRNDHGVLKFDFDETWRVNSRIFLLTMSGTELPAIVEDRLVVDGIEASVAKVFLAEQAGPSGNGDFFDGLCLICCTNPATVITCPCRHCCMCRTCSERFASVSNCCPVCRAAVVELIDCGGPDESL